MARCVNEECPNDPFESADTVVVSMDGDAACCRACAEAHRSQMDRFCREVLPSAKRTEEWLLGLPPRRGARRP